MSSGLPSFLGGRKAFQHRALLWPPGRSGVVFRKRRGANPQPGPEPHRLPAFPDLQLPGLWVPGPDAGSLSLIIFTCHKGCG